MREIFGWNGFTYRDARSNSLFVEDIVCSELDRAGVERREEGFDEGDF